MTNTSPTNADDGTPNDDQTDLADETLPHGDAPTDDETPDSPRSNLTAVVVEHDLKADQCTLYPEDASEEDLVTEWITAEEGSYVELEEMR